MAKKAFGRKKGIEHGISKHRVRRKGKVGEENNETAAPKFLGISRSKLAAFGEKCFDFSLACCEKFYLVGFRRTENGEYVPLGRKAQIFHYAVTSCLLVICTLRIWITVEMFMYEDIRMESFICLSLPATYTIGLLVSMGVLMRPKETMDLLNSFTHFSASLKMIDPSCEFHPLGNLSASIKVTGDFFVHHGLVCSLAVSTVFIDGIPVYMFSIAERYGLISEGVIPNLVWKLMFMPFEGFIVWLFMVTASLSASCLFMEIGALNEYVQRLRSMNIHSMRSRQRVEQMYVQLELFNRIAQVWIRYYFPPWLIGLSGGVIVPAFVTIRYTEVPFFVYISFPYCVIQLSILIFWQSYDMLRVIQASEDILGELRKHHAPYFQGMTRDERINKMKRSRAMTTLVFPLGDSEFSIGLPINTWDEILNQTLFLLSL